MGVDGEKPQDWKIRQYYEQEEVIEKILEICQYREVAPTYPQGYGKRPDAINFRGDLEHFTEKGAVALHASVERWKNPLLIDNISDLDKLRTNWDLVIDIDCDESFEVSKKAAKLVIQELESHGIENISVKFSGNRGFHIGVRGESFPEEIEGKKLEKFYPELPRAIIDYLRSNLRKHLIEIVREHGYEDVMKTDSGLDPFQVADIENDWGQRHLFRVPYSLHDGSWLVSKPIRKENIEDFEKEQAQIDNVDFEVGFLEDYTEKESINLAVQALDFKEERREERKKERIEQSKNQDFDRPDEAIPEQYFPPTIKNILDGLEDGRKRGLFILINFYRVVGYSWNEIETKIWEWNEENKEPLRESYVKGQLRWHENRGEDVPPPNYDSNGYYKDMNVYEGDNLEEKVSNPVSYAFRKAKKRNTDNNSNQDNKGPVECPVCGKEYKSENKYYKKHVQQCFE